MDSHVFDTRTPVEIENGPNDAALVTIKSIPIQPDLIESRRIIFPAFPTTFLAPIAAVLVQWGAFEQSLDLGLADLKHASADITAMPRMFSAKKSQFLALCGALFARRPKIIDHVNVIFNEADVVYSRRNLLAHGQLSAKVDIVNPEGRDMLLTDVVVSVIGEGINKGGEISHTFTVLSLRDDFYKAANLGGRLEELFYEGVIPGLSLEDTAMLQALRQARTQSDAARGYPQT